MTVSSTTIFDGVIGPSSNQSAFISSENLLTISNDKAMNFNQTTQSLELCNKVYILDILVGWVVGITVEHNAEGFVKDKFYGGSRFLQPITDMSGIPLDFVNFIVSSLFSLLFGLFMRHHLPPGKVGYRVRALVEFSLGVGVVSFCYGMQLRVLILQSFVAYLILLLSRRERVQTAVAVTLWSLLYMMLIHLCRLYYDYEGYTLDISGALMLQTQRLSSLAFNLYDGARIRKANERNSKQEGLRVNGFGPENREIELEPAMAPSSRGYAVEKLPDPVVFAAYSIYFHGVCIGPFVYFKNYQDYLHGYKTGKLPPINQRRLFTLMMQILAYGLLYASFFTHFPIPFINKPEFQEMTLIGRFTYMSYAFFIARLKYYFGWCLAEAMGICAGNGYSGTDPTTKETFWMNVHNFDFFQVEASLNLKLLIDAWNIGTVSWLREVVYIRAPPQFRTVIVFMVSAFWHGLYPGYYFTFLSFTLFTYAARAWRRNMRHRIIYLSSNERVSCVVRVVYDAATILLTHFIMEYSQAPFHLLGFVASWTLWKQFYFLPHLVAVGLILVLPGKQPHAHNHQLANGRTAEEKRIY